MLKRLFSSQTHYFPECHGKRPCATRTCIPILKFKYLSITVVHSLLKFITYIYILQIVILILIIDSLINLINL